MFNNIYQFLEILGTVAFAISGTVVGINRQLDLFGVLNMSVITAVGGGIVRDLCVGNIPPSTLKSPFYIIISIISSIIAMLVAVIIKKRKNSLSIIKVAQIYHFILILSDAIGLGIFTVIGIDSGISRGYDHNLFLIIFLGVVTGVGGGMIRDVIANQVPMIFRENIYAVSCIIGGILYVILLPLVPHYFSALISMASIVVIRMISEYKHLSLPRIEY